MLTRSQRGLSLIELLIAMAAGLVVVGAGLSFLTSALGAASANLLRVRMHQDLQSTMEAIARDLARAGEWALADEVAQAASTSDLRLTGTHGSIAANALEPADATPKEAFDFPNAAAALRGATLALLQRQDGIDHRYDLVITGVPTPDRLTLSVPDGVVLPQTELPAGSWSILNPFAGVIVSETGSCVLLRYDLDGNGIEDDEEHFGFRLNGPRTAIQATTTARDCASGNWDAFTDPAFLRIAAFDVRRLRAPRMAARPIGPAVDAWLIDIEARLARDRDAIRSLQHLVHSRNAALE
jgi:prepilin-type N-terminal cleavage/methylation domain-containing protein